MALFDKIPFRGAIAHLMTDRESPSPIPEELHVGLAAERDLMCKILTEKARVAAGVAGVVADDVAPLLHARDKFLDCIVHAAHFVAEQRASTSHIWADNIFKAIVNRDSSSIVEIRDVLRKFDEIALAWESFCAMLPHVEENLAVVFDQPLHQHVGCPIAIDTVSRLYYARLDQKVSYKHVLLAICALVDLAHVFRVVPRSSRTCLVLSEDDVRYCLTKFANAPRSLRSRLFYIAGAARTTMYQRLNDQTSTYSIVSKFRINGDPEDGDASDDDSRDAAAHHVRRSIISIWTNVNVSKQERQTNLATNPDYSYILEMTRGNLRCPAGPFADAFVASLMLADVLFMRLECRRPRVELPDELFQMHASIVRSTLYLARGVFGTVPDHVSGWTDYNTRALWRMFVRFAVLTAFRQVQRRNVGAPSDAFNASSGSFRQTASATASRSSSHPTKSSGARRRSSAGVASSTGEPAVTAFVGAAQSLSSQAAAPVDQTGDDAIEQHFEVLQSMCDALVRPQAADYDVDIMCPGGLPSAELDDDIAEDGDDHDHDVTGGGASSAVVRVDASECGSMDHASDADVRVSASDPTTTGPSCIVS